MIRHSVATPSTPTIFKSRYFRIRCLLTCSSIVNYFASFPKYNTLRQYLKMSISVFRFSGKTNADNVFVSIPRSKTSTIINILIRNWKYFLSMWKSKIVPEFQMN